MSRSPNVTRSGLPALLVRGLANISIITCSFLRNIESPSQRLDDPARNTTVLAPLNSAIEKLPRKPWEDPKDYSALGANAYEGEDGQERAQRNLRRFVEAHLIPTSPWPAGEKVKPVGGDTEVWWEEKDGVKRVRGQNKIMQHPSQPEMVVLTPCCCRSNREISRLSV